MGVARVSSSPVWLLLNAATVVGKGGSAWCVFTVKPYFPALCSLFLVLIVITKHLVRPRPPSTTDGWGGTRQMLLEEVS